MQLSLPFSHRQEDLLSHLTRLTGYGISLTITDNVSSMISYRKKGPAVALRLHRIFLQADRTVIEELGQFIRNRRHRTPLIRRYILEHAGSVAPKPSRKQVLVTRGRHHDLSAVSQRVNAAYFNGRISAGITWGSKKVSHGIRRRILGSYNSRTNTIRINPVLDRKDVPLYYLEFIVYHEMLHADLGVEKKNGRRSVHPRTFREKERLFHHYDKALLWEKRS
ncbi:MAG: hypothetical protein EPN25_06375 [Nitrospirae bacterium]|nr:MAG: hypothetical protein EPN25_06375 [Nitrospirota bacterium]